MWNISQIVLLINRSAKNGQIKENFFCCRLKKSKLKNRRKTTKRNQRTVWRTTCDIDEKLVKTSPRWNNIFVSFFFTLTANHPATTATNHIAFHFIVIWNNGIWSNKNKHSNSNKIFYLCSLCRIFTIIVSRLIPCTSTEKEKKIVVSDAGVVEKKLFDMLLLFD